MESALVLASPPDVQTVNNAFHGSSISGRRKENRLLFTAGIVAQALHEQTPIASPIEKSSNTSRPGFRTRVSAPDVDGRDLARAVPTQKFEAPCGRDLETRVFINQPFAVTVDQLPAFDDRIGPDQRKSFLNADCPLSGIDSYSLPLPL